MTGGEFLTRLSIWLALGAYAIGAGMPMLARGRSDWVGPARWAWTLGCGFFLAHAVCAFSYYHHWSHADAFRETARQTGEMTGFRWGGGLYLNYLVLIGWLADVVWWWVAPGAFARRSPRLAVVWHSFLFFMILNGTVVFGSGPVRWLGALICAGLAGLWWWRREADMADARK